MKKHIALGIAVIVLGAGFYYSELRFLSHSRPNASATPIAAQGNTLPARASLPAATGTAQAGTHAGGQSQGVTLAERNATSTKTASIEFTLSVGGKNYHGTVRVGATVLDAMNELASSGDFKFTSKEFPGMGTFVESINGKAGADGFYWILYVRGTLSQTGASQTIVNPGDNIEWKYEKGY
ncbi:MAG: DUF4430 domain-containing protein [bacterium]|nr:DUF4430 domain-containing protein [bacterium]